MGMGNVCVCVCLCIMIVHCLWRAVKGDRSCGTGVNRWLCVAVSILGSKPGPLEEKSGLLTTVNHFSRPKFNFLGDVSYQILFIKIKVGEETAVRI